jgi:hypothetical protein
MILLFPLRLHNGSVSYLSPTALGGANVESFLGLAMASLMAGAVPALLFAWLLRRIMTRFPAAGMLLWIGTGAVLALLLCFLLGAGEKYFWPGNNVPGILRPVIILMFAGPAAVFQSGLLSSVPAGAITGYVLFLVYRAFEPQKEFPPS